MRSPVQIRSSALEDLHIAGPFLLSPPLLTIEKPRGFIFYDLAAFFAFLSFRDIITEVKKAKEYTMTMVNTFR